MCKNMQNKYSIYFISSKYDGLLSYLTIVWIYKKNIPIYILYIYIYKMHGWYVLSHWFKYNLNLIYCHPNS